MTRKFAASIYALTLLVAGFAGFSVTSASAAPTAAAKPAIIAIIDSRRLFSESLVSKNIRDQLMAMNQGLTTKENTTKDALLKEKDELDKQKTLLVQEVFEQKYNQLKQKADKLNRDIEVHRQQMNVAQAKANQELQAVLQPIIGAVAAQRGATMVFEKSQIVWQSAGMDVTTEVIESLDKKLPTLAVKMPTEAEIMQMINDAQGRQ